MELQTYSRPREAVSLEAFGRAVVRRREATGVAALPRNSGTRRTPSKYALLASLEETGARW
jgi:hypothetical protein